MVNPVWLKDKPPPAPGPLWKDFGLSAISGLRSGVEGAAGGLGDIREGLGNWFASKVGANPETINSVSRAVLPLPTSEEVGQVTDKAVSLLPDTMANAVQGATRHKSATPGGSLVNTIGNLGTGMIGGPETLLAKGGAMLPIAKAMFIPIARKPGLMEEVDRLVAKGLSEDDIYKQTGALNRHGHWMFEISDKGATFNPNPAPRMYTPQYQPPASMSFLQPATPPKPYRIANTTGDFLNHPELRKFMPEVLDETRASIGWTEPGTAGHLVPPTYSTVDPLTRIKPGEVVVNQKLPLEQQLSVALHEVQHDISERAGWPKGGNPNDLTLVRDANDLRKKAQDMFDQIDPSGYFSQMETERNKFIMESMDKDYEARQVQDYLEGLQPRMQDYRRQWNEANPEKAQAIDKVYKTAWGEDYNNNPTYYAYMHMADETLARNVQARMKMSEDALREKPPSKTEDYPPELQIIRRGRY